MSDLTNLTDRIVHLRDQKNGSNLVSSHSQHTGPAEPALRSRRERRFATDMFMIFVYALLAVSLISQIGLILSLDFPFR